MNAAQAVLSRTIAERGQLSSGTLDAEIAAAESTLAEAEAFWKDAQIYYDGIQARGDEVKDWVKRESAIRLLAAEQSLQAARMRLAFLRATTGARLRGADAVASKATAVRNAARARLDMLLVGATAEEIAVAEAGVSKARVVLDQALVALERTEVRAPFDGTIGAVDTRIGELVVAGQPLVTLGDLSTLRVETTDLDEVDVAKVAVGQRVDVSFDVLLEKTFAGTITRISPMAAPGSGGVNYTVVVEVDAVAWWGNGVRRRASRCAAHRRRPEPVKSIAASTATLVGSQPIKLLPEQLKNAHRCRGHLENRHENDGSQLWLPACCQDR